MSSAPTADIIKAANIQRVDYSISLTPNSTFVGFNNSTSDGELSFKLRVSNNRVGEMKSITVYDYSTCKSTPYDASIIDATYDISGAESATAYDDVPVNVDIKTELLSRYSHELYSENSSLNTANIKFCVRADLGNVSLLNNGTIIDSAVSYIMLKFSIAIDLALNFSSAEVETVEIGPTEETSTSNIDYPVNACECDAATRICDTTPVPKTQNSDVTICLYIESEEFFIGDIKTMIMTQIESGLALNIISNFTTNPFTTKSVTSSKQEVVSSRMISAFFDSPSTVTVSGTVIMGFAQSTRKLVGFETKARVLEKNMIRKSTFALDMELDNDISNNAVTIHNLNVDVVMIIVSMVMAAAVV